MSDCRFGVSPVTILILILILKMKMLHQEKTISAGVMARGDDTTISIAQQNTKSNSHTDAAWHARIMQLEVKLLELRVNTLGAKLLVISKPDSLCIL